MAVSSTTVLPPTRNGRALFISSSVLGAFGAFQLLMLAWFFIHVRRAVPPVRPTIHFAETIQPSTSSMEAPFRIGSSALSPPGPVPSRPFAAAPATSIGGDAAPSIERPTPAPSARYPAADLIEQAKLLRQNGDANSALAKLRMAQNADPDNPQVIAELGITYEAMQLPDRAFEQWQRLYGMGDAVGALFYLADAKLHGGAASAAPPIAAGAPASAPRVPAVANATAGRDASGFQDNALLKITGIQSEDQDDPAAEKKVALKIVVKNRPGSAIDPKKVKIETYFYDLLDGKDVVQTDAQTGFAWLTAPVNWANDESEVLETTYFRTRAQSTPAPAGGAAPDDADNSHASRRRKPKGHAGDSQDASPVPVPALVRTYLGYTVRLYYDRQLQDVQADPLRLLQQFPPPLTLSDE